MTKFEPAILIDNKEVFAIMQATDADFRKLKWKDVKNKVFMPDADVEEFTKDSFMSAREFREKYVVSGIVEIIIAKPRKK